MNDEDFEKECARINRIRDEWHDRLSMNSWKILYNFEREKYRGHLDNDLFPIAMTCRADWQYSQAMITFYLPTTIDYEYDTVERCYIHEVMHVLLNELRVTDSDEAKLQYKHEEHVAEQLSYCFQWTFRDGKDAAKVTYDAYEG